MKHLKNYENLKDSLIPIRVTSDQPNVYSIDLIPGEMYSHEDDVFCYVGNTGKEPFNNLCLLFSDTDSIGRFYFVQWNSWFYARAIRIHKSVKEYIIEKKIVGKTVNSLMICKFSERPTTKVMKMAYNLRDSIINDPYIKMIIDSEKYNL